MTRVLGYPLRTRLLGAFVVLATLAAFWPATNGGFLGFDDNVRFLQNFAFRGLSGAHLQWMFTDSIFSGNYEPLTWVVHALTHSVWKLDPFGYHLIALLLHGAAAGMMFLVSLRLLRLTVPADTSDAALARGAAASALLFSLHPLRAEVVSWASAQHYSLAAVLWLGSVECYLRSTADLPKKLARRTFYWLSVLLFLFSLLSFSIVMTLPAVLLILDIYPLKRIPADPRRWMSPQARRILLEKAPFLILAIGAAALTLYSRTATNTLVTLDDHGPIARVMQFSYGICYYAIKTVIPTDLMPFYFFRRMTEPFAPSYLLAATAVVSAAGIMIYRRHRAPGTLAVWSYVIITLMPVSGLLQSGAQFAADRYTYLPAMGVSLLAGGLIIRLLGRQKKLLLLYLPAAFSALLLIFAGISWRQARIWHSDETLWDQVIRLDPKSPVALIAQGNRARKAGDLDTAISHYSRALAVQTSLHEAQYGVGSIFIQRGRPRSAVVYLGNAARIVPSNPAYRNAYGTALMMSGKPQQAIGHYRAALELNPFFVGVHLNWAMALTDMSRYDEAIDQYRQALVMRPDLYDAHFNMGSLIEFRGNAQEAVKHYRETLRLSPDHVPALNSLGAAHARQGKVEEALALYRKALRIDPANARARANLNSALSELGR